MRKAPRLSKPSKLKVYRPRVGAGRAPGAAGAGGSPAADDTGDSSVYRAPTGSSQGQVGSADPTSFTDQDNSGLVGGTQDYARRSSSNPAGDMGGSPGLAQMRKLYR
jgi:hypothetical protein